MRAINPHPVGDIYDQISQACEDDHSSGHILLLVCFILFDYYSCFASGRRVPKRNM
jgi:hypothetical protein